MDIYMYYNQTQIKENSSGLGARHGLRPDRNSLPAVIVRDPRKAADLVKFQNRQYSLDERRTRDIFTIRAQYPG